MNSLALFRFNLRSKFYVTTETKANVVGAAFVVGATTGSKWDTVGTRQNETGITFALFDALSCTNFWNPGSIRARDWTGAAAMVEMRVGWTPEHIRIRETS